MNVDLHQGYSENINKRKLTPFSHGSKQKLQNVTRYDPYILLSTGPRFIWSCKRS